MSKLYEDLVAIETMQKIVDLVEQYPSEEDYLSDSDAFGIDVQKILVEYTDFNFGKGE